MTIFLHSSQKANFLCVYMHTYIYLHIQKIINNYKNIYLTIIYGFIFQNRIASILCCMPIFHTHSINQ